MISIKSSFANCLECELFDASSCILETNCKNMEDVDVIFIAENPGKTEVEHEPPLPLIGKAGLIFRKYFKMYDLNKLNYLLTNTVLCQTLLKDGTTGNPKEEVIEQCKINCFKIIETCKPKLIVLMGTSAAKAFEIMPKGSKITNVRGNMFKWNDYDILLTYHPSYIGRNRIEEPKFEEDLKKVSELMGTTKLKKKENMQVSDKSGIFFYKIPDKFYTSNYMLVDVQYLNKTNEVLYIFRDKDNKKVYHKESDLYVCYQTQLSLGKLTYPYSDLKQVKIPYRQKSQLDPKITYEGDLKITVKHSQDYYLQKKEEEPNIDLNIMYLDIETFSKGMEASPPEEANDIICMLSYWYDNKLVTYTIDPLEILKDSSKKVTLSDIEICKNEKELLTKFIRDFRKLDPDILTGWYCDGFDIPYIVNRCKKLGIDPNAMSKFGEVDVDMNYGKIHIAGCVMTDMLFLYKSFTFGGKESYSLDYIANLEIGEGKLGKGYRFSEMFRNDPDQAIKYNQQDVLILKNMNNKLMHVSFQNEIRKICRTCFDVVKSSMGQLDSLLVSFLKERGIASRNADIHEKGDKFEGAYVKEPIPGLHEYLVDFDFSSLYPSLILTYNIGVNTFIMKLKDYKLGYELCYDIDNFPDKTEVIIDPLFENKEVVMNKEEILKEIKDNDLIYTINGCFYKKHDKELSFYAEILDMLLKSRKIYKNKMFEAKTKEDKINENYYDMKQMVYKVLANSIYGILGNNAFRFFNIDCARTITLSGQESLKNSIIQADTYVDTKIKNKEYQVPKKLSKNEMYLNLDRDILYVITGDTDSIFLTYKKLVENNSEEEILNKINILNTEVQKFLNEEIITEIVKKHNSDVNRLELKNELVIKRGLFLAKKRYALHVIAQEGKKFDYIKPMGLETRRSDFPSLTKERLNELLEKLLKSNPISISKILTYVKETEKEILEKIKLGKKEIARPVSFTKNLNDYKVIPQGVKGMVNFNNLEYHVFGVGARGYLFKLKGIDLDKAPKEIVDNYEKFFNSEGKKIEEIVIPETLLKLPEYYIIDEKSMLKFSWTDRHSLLLEPLVKVENKMLTF